MIDVCEATQTPTHTHSHNYSVSEHCSLNPVGERARLALRMLLFFAFCVSEASRYEKSLLGLKKAAPVTAPAGVAPLISAPIIGGKSPVIAAPIIGGKSPAIGSPSAVQTATAPTIAAPKIAAFGSSLL